MARILVIEDDRSSRELLAYLLTASGHDPILAEDGEAGITAALEHHPDLILCDIGLPGIGGVDVLARLRRDEALDAVDVVAVTAFAMVGDREQLLAAGFDGYISKPIDPERFVEQIGVYLTAAGAAVAPRDRRRGQRSSIETRPRARPRRRRVIVVDDSAANLDVIATVLRGDGYEVETTQSIEEAFTLARKHPPDLFLSDVHMRPRDGFEVLDALRADAALRDVRAGLISSSAWSTRDRDRADRAGAAGFLIRPLDPTTLAEAVAAMIDSPRPRPRTNP